jgi:nucleotide-binding universal stress UspA family protein
MSEPLVGRRRGMSYATLMAHIELGIPNDRLLAVTASLAERFSARIVGVAAAQPIQIVGGGMYATGDLLELDRELLAKETGAAETSFRSALKSKCQSLNWRTAMTFAPLADYICDQARSADLIITRPDRGGVPFEGSRRTDVGDLVMRAGRPVLIVPDEAPPLALNHAVVGWKDTRESRRAVADALPLLECAGAITIVEIAARIDLAAAEERLKDVAAWLAAHGIIAETLAVEAHGDTAEQLDDIAERKGADLIVAGAYGHSRLREWVFGGVTAQILMHPRRCALVSH